MPSPFPGMDPYIEHRGYWGDCHGSLIAAIRDHLNARLPSDYAAAIDQYVWIHEPDAEMRRRRREPDVYVAAHRQKEEKTQRTAVVAAPATVILPAEPRRSSKFVKIEDMASRQIVTAIELLSPINKKKGADRDAYLAKRGEYLASNVNVVEIDLLLKGVRPPFEKPLPRRSDYYVMVYRFWECPEAGYWPLSLRDPLPDVPVPLTPEEDDVMLPLQECFNRVYDAGRFPLKLRYEARPAWRAPGKDLEWAKRLLNGRKA